MVYSSCLKEEFSPITEVKENEWIIRFSPKTEQYPVYDEQGNPTGEIEESGFVVFTEEKIVGELTPDMVRWVRLNELKDYDKSSEVNIFYYNDLPMWYDYTIRASLNYSMSIEQSIGRTETQLFDDNGNGYTVNIEAAKALFAQVELYAKECYNVTANHKHNLLALDNIDDILAYNIKTGYPEKLHFNAI